MGILILISLVVAHCIYIPLAVPTTRNASIDDLSVILVEKYVACLFWPFIFGAAACLTAYVILVYCINVMKRFFDYIGDVYWDISMFYAFLLTISTKP